MAVALAACGPSLGGGDEHGDPSESDTSGGACDCNWVPTDCELFLPPDVDDG